jgi:hypothetical protein
MPESESSGSSPSSTDPHVLLQQALLRIQQLENAFSNAVTNNNNASAVIPLSSSHEPKVGHPEPFDGTRSKLRTFLALCENVFTAQPSVYGVFNTQSYNTLARITFAVSYLRAAAMEWWISLRGTNHPALSHWSAFQTALIEQYDDPEAKRNSQLALEQLRQLRGQSIADFTQKFRPLGTASGLSEGELLYRFRRSLLPEIQDGLVFSPTPVTLSDLVASATKCEVRIAERLLDARGVAPSLATTPGPAPMDLGATYSRPQQSSSSSRHISAEIRAERLAKGLCLYCGLAGHRVRQCPTAPSNRSVNSNNANKATSN